MGKKVHIDAVRRFISSTPAFRAKDVEVLTGDRGYALLALHNLERKGEVHRVTRGWYSAGEDPTVAVSAFSPAYLGLQDALSLRGAWEQETNVVIVTCSKAKPGVREALGSRIVVHRIDPEYFFGFDFLPYGKAAVPVSDVEKTLIDLVYFGESPGREVLRRLLGRSDEGVLRGYLERYPGAFRSRFAKEVGEGAPLLP